MANMPHSMQMNNGLMRYHSAPTSMLASLVDDDFLPRDSDGFVEESEFAQFLHDHPCMPNHLVDSKPLPPAGLNSSPLFATEEARICSTVNETRPQLQMEKQRLTPQQSQYMATEYSRPTTDATRGPLSSILEHGANESSDFCGATQLNGHLEVGEWKTLHSNFPKPFHTTTPNSGRLLPYMKSNLARHNSSPADVLSRLVKDEGTGETFLHFGSSFMHASKEGSIMKHVGMPSPLPAQSTKHVSMASPLPAQKTIVEDAICVKSLVEENTSCLLRQRSSPATLLSQISFDGMSSSTNAALSPSLLSRNYSEEDNRARAYQAATFWDEIVSDNPGSVHRKRARECQGMHTSELTFANQEAPPLGGPVKMCSGSLGGTEVLCRVSAKRGFATHPRSITERVRRKKINDGIRKLQELMPNMEKQTNTVTMLDEAVEYVKSLQRQVKELSERRPKCNGQCSLKGNA